MGETPARLRAQGVVIDDARQQKRPYIKVTWTDTAETSGQIDPIGLRIVVSPRHSPRIDFQSGARRLNHSTHEELCAEREPCVE